MEKAKRKIPLWLRVALGVMVAIFALIAAGVALRYWITSDAGRAFMAGLGGESFVGGPETLASFQKEELESMRRIAKLANIQQE